jgi:hypothetical protein
MEAADLWGIAYHEAGHAVVAWSFDLKVHNIYIREGDVLQGKTCTDCAAHLPLVDQVAVLAAGIVATQVFERPLPVYFAQRDREQTLNLILSVLSGIELEQIDHHRKEGENRARDRLVKHKSKVIRLAECLFDVRHVDGPKFARLISA